MLKNVSGNRFEETMRTDQDVQVLEDVIQMEEENDD